MTPSESTIIHFYQQLGKLFYSVASVDKTVRKEEVAQLNEIVKNEWVPLENNHSEFGDDAAYQIEIVFDWLLENDWKVAKAIPDFKNFRKEHPSLFTPPVNDLILKTAKTIVNSFSGKNKSELALINELSGILHQEH